MSDSQQTSDKAFDFHPSLLVLETVFDTLPSGLMLLQSEDSIEKRHEHHLRILKINQRGHALLELDPEQSYPGVENLPEYLEAFKHMLLYATGNIQRGEVTLELPNRDEPSTIGFNLSFLETSAALEGDELMFVIALTFTDITQVLKDRQAMDKIKDELQQSKKLASIGTMISGVAHELNNPLTGISMSAELSRMNLGAITNLLKADVEKGQVDVEALSNKIDKTLNEVLKISKSCQKAAILVGELLSFSKPTQLVTEATPYVALVEETVNALRSHPDFGRFDISLSPPEDAETWLIRVDKVKIEQVFYNLCKNALDAVEGVGSLEITFSKSKSPTGTPWLVAHVKDYGPGIDTSILGRIFDPFFSTKGNKGVGLGLSISYRTLEQHGGQLSVTSQQGEWSEFQVALPLYQEN